MTPRQNNNWIPPRFWTVVIDTDVFRMMKLKLEGVHKKVYESFKSRALLGTEVPDLTLRSVTGETVRLREFHGRKHLVLEFGAVT